MWWMPNLWPLGRTAASLSRRELLLEEVVLLGPRLVPIGVEDSIVAKPGVVNEVCGR
jgi:hypothetical protein